MKIRRRELGLYAAVALAVAILFLPLLTHPTWVIFDGSSDLIEGHLPYRGLLANSLRRGDGLPAYDPTAFAGVPLAADPQSNLTYPPNWLHAISDDGAPAVFGWLMLLHVLVGGWGVLFWLGPRKFDAPARFSAALTFMLAGKWMHHVLSSGHINMLPLAWVPLQLALIDRVVRSARRRDVACLAIATALVVNGSHPQLTLYSQVLVATYALLGLVRSGKAGLPYRGPALIAATVLGLALSTWYLLPILGGLDFFVRGGGMHYLATVFGALTPSNLIEALLPGEPREASNFVIFTGSAVLALASFAWAARSHRATSLFFLVTSALVVAYAMGHATGVHGFVDRWFPGFSLFRRPARVWLVSGVPLAWLVAAGMTALGRASIPVSLRTFAIVLLLCGATLFLRAPDAETAWVAVGFGLPALLVVGSVFGLPGKAGWAVAVLIACQLLRYSSPLVETRPESEVLVPNTLAESLRKPLGRGRVLSLNVFPMSSAPFPPDINTRYGLEGLRGYNPLIPRRTLDLLLRSVEKPDETLTRSAARIPVGRPRNRAPFDLLNTQWVISSYEVDLEGLELRRVHVPEVSDPESKTTSRAFRARRFVYENVRRMPRAAVVRNARLSADGEDLSTVFDESDPRDFVLVEDPDLVGRYPGDFRSVPVVRRGDGLSLEVDAGSGGYLVISEFAYPGWKAVVDGRAADLHEVNGSFLGLRLDAGEHSVELVYRPRALVVGFWITVAALFVTAGLLAFDGARPRAGAETRALFRGSPERGVP